MPFLLLLLLAAIGLVITLVGYLLTPKTQLQPRNQRTAYQAGYDVNRSGRRVREPVTTRNVRYVAAFTEESTWTWADMWQSLSISRVFRRRLGEPNPWLGITLILVSVFLLGMFILRTLMPNATLIGALSWPLASPNSSSQSHSPQEGPYTASQSLVRLSQLDPSQYNSTQEYNRWAYSACSAAAMTEVINAYGHHFRVTDILKVEAQIGEITPELGLVEKVGIARTVAHFGFKTAWGDNLSLDNIIDVANHGRPVIVGWPPARYAGGHLLVVIGGNSKYVYLADSSLYNRHSLTREQFMNWWEGFAAIVTPD
ncbi:MAG: C39 family peptidase [Ktedonobacteraceae bacterium]